MLLDAVATLREGGFVAFPAETVCGLGAGASNPVAVAKIFAAEGRPADHSLIVHVGGAALLAQWAAEIPDSANKLAAASWPGPLTMTLRKAATANAGAGATARPSSRREDRRSYRRTIRGSSCASWRTHRATRISWTRSRAASRRATGSSASGAKLDVPLVVEAGVGENWEKAH